MGMIVDLALMTDLICQLMLQEDISFQVDFKEEVIQHATVALAIKSTAKRVTIV